MCAVAQTLALVCCDDCAGPEGEEREQDDDAGAEQHLSTSGQPQQTPAVHFRIHPDVTDTPFRRQAPSIKRASAGYFENNPRCYSVESFTRKCLHVTAANG